MCVCLGGGGAAGRSTPQAAAPPLSVPLKARGPLPCPDFAYLAQADRAAAGSGGWVCVVSRPSPGYRNSQSDLHWTAPCKSSIEMTVAHMWPSVWNTVVSFDCIDQGYTPGKNMFIYTMHKSQRSISMPFDTSTFTFGGQTLIHLGEYDLAAPSVPRSSTQPSRWEAATPIHAARSRCQHQDYIEQRSMQSEESTEARWSCSRSFRGQPS